MQLYIHYFYMPIVFLRNRKEAQGGSAINASNDVDLHDNIDGLHDDVDDCCNVNDCLGGGRKFIRHCDW